MANVDAVIGATDVDLMKFEIDTDDVSAVYVESFTIEADVDESKLAAQLKNGVLAIRLPIREEEKPKEISIEVQ